jgi:WD40 repeat protein
MIWICSGTYENTINVWDLRTLECIRTLPGHTGAVYTLAIMGNKLFSGSYDATIRVRNWTALCLKHFSYLITYHSLTHLTQLNSTQLNSTQLTYPLGLGFEYVAMHAKNSGSSKQCGSDCYWRRKRLFCFHWLHNQSKLVITLLRFWIKYSTINKVDWICSDLKLYVVALASSINQNNKFTSNITLCVKEEQIVY